MKNFKQKITDSRYRLAQLAVLAAGVASTNMAGAAGEIDLSAAQTTVTSIVAVGVAVTTALTVYGLGKRAARKA
jgi:hypothetical protein